MTQQTLKKYYYRKKPGSRKKIRCKMPKTHRVRSISTMRASQTGKSDKGIDKQYRAKYPGKRKSRSGKTYYEYRKNRSDASRKQRY